MSHTILVADDSVTIQRAIQIAFDKEPYRVVRAMNGEEALQQAKAATPSIILVDHAMPGKTGYEVAEALRGDPSTSSIPVLFMSGPSAPYDEARAQQAGVVGHIAKPFDCQTLIEKVGAVLGVAPSVPLSGPSTPAAAPLSAVAAALPRPPGPVSASPFLAPAPVAASPTPVAAAPVAVTPMAATPVARADPFGLAANVSAHASSSSSASEEEEDISFGFEEAKKPAAPSAPLVPTQVSAPVAAAAEPHREPVAVTTSVVAAMSHSIAAAAAPAIAAAVDGNGASHGASPAAITAATREIIEQIVWEVVPELAEAIIREEIARLLRERN